jgi:hypothetical protein
VRGGGRAHSVEDVRLGIVHGKERHDGKLLWQPARLQQRDELAEEDMSDLVRRVLHRERKQHKVLRDERPVRFSGREVQQRDGRLRAHARLDPGAVGGMHQHRTLNIE